MFIGCNWLIKSQIFNQISENNITPKHLDGLLGILVQGSSLRFEDGHVGLEQVLPLHALLSGH